MKIYKVSWGNTHRIVDAWSPNAALLEVAGEMFDIREATTEDMLEEATRISNGDPYPCMLHGAEYCGTCGP